MIHLVSCDVCLTILIVCVLVLNWQCIRYNYTPADLSKLVDSWISLLVYYASSTL